MFLSENKFNDRKESFLTKYYCKRSKLTPFLKICMLTVISKLIVTFTSFGQVTLVIFLTLGKLKLSVTFTNFGQITIAIFTTLSKSWTSAFHMGNKKHFVF